MNLKDLYKFTIEGVVIFASVFLSFYLENTRSQNKLESDKNELVYDLTTSLELDLKQIKSLLEILNLSNTLITEIQNDINANHSIYSDNEIMDKLIKISVGSSFFPNDGIFNQLIATGKFELIKNNKLKTKLLKIFNHMKERNYALSEEIDIFNFNYRKLIMVGFRIQFSYNAFEGEFYGSQKIENFNFNDNFYFSDAFFGELSQAKIYIGNYSRILKDIEKEYESTIDLAQVENRNFN
ncbi:hypothetical protein OA501_02165 [Flavobacteriaceae bacterium]|nr:hypothetical protein [Flavobacteriaceae bacterium]